MTDGGYTVEEAAKLQNFTGKKECGAGDTYTGESEPPCTPDYCEKCFLKWIDRLNEV